MFNKDFTAEDLILYLFCIGLVTFLGIYFWELKGNEFHKTIPIPGEKELIESIKISQGKGLDNDSKVKTDFLRAQLVLIHRRYQFASKISRYNTILRQIGFLIGTLLVVLGTMIVIRGVRDSNIDLEIKGLERAKIKFTTSSPGIFLAFIGSLVIIVTIIKGGATSFDDDGITNPAATTVLDIIPVNDSENTETE